MMSNTYHPPRRTSHANPSVTLDALDSTKNPVGDKTIVEQNAAQTPAVDVQLASVATHAASVANFEAYSVEYPTTTSSPSVLMM